MITPIEIDDGTARMKRSRVGWSIEKRRTATLSGSAFAATTEIADDSGDKIQNTHRLNIPKQ